MSPYSEFAEYIAKANPPAFASFRPSNRAQARFEHLVELATTHQLTVDERSELDRFMQFEHLLRLAKAQAKLILASA